VATTSQPLPLGQATFSSRLLSQWTSWLSLVAVEVVVTELAALNALELVAVRLEVTGLRLAHRAVGPLPKAQQELHYQLTTQ
jgi:hypothetical protein